MSQLYLYVNSQAEPPKYFPYNPLDKQPRRSMCALMARIDSLFPHNNQVADPQSNLGERRRVFLENIRKPVIDCIVADMQQFIENKSFVHFNEIARVVENMQDLVDYLSEEVTPEEFASYIQTRKFSYSLTNSASLNEFLISPTATVAFPTLRSESEEDKDLVFKSLESFFTQCDLLNMTVKDSLTLFDDFFSDMGKDREGSLLRVKEVYEKPFFHGFISSEKADILLEERRKELIKINENGTVYLIVFSQGYLTLKSLPLHESKVQDLLIRYSCENQAWKIEDHGSGASRFFKTFEEIPLGVYTGLFFPIFKF